MLNPLRLQVFWRFKVSLTLAATFCLSTAVCSQPSLRIQELLRLPAAEKWLDEDRPADNDSVIFWEWGHLNRPHTSEQRELLWAACQRHPERIGDMRQYLPDRPDVDKFVNATLKKIPGEETRIWLRRRGRFLKQELIAQAVAGNADDLLALVRHDPKAARSHLHRLNSDLALAAELLLEPHRFDLRGRMQAIACNPKAGGARRVLACRTLSRLRWPGQEKFMHHLWGLLPDGWVREDPIVYPILEYWVADDPDRWIPLMVSWLNDKNRVVHNNAVACLVQFHLKNCRPDALRPLFPWLLNPRWSEARDRLRLIQTLDRFEAPEAVPGLIAIVAAEKDEFERSYAAETLAHYPNPAALPALRQALAREKFGHHRERYLKALLACGGLDEAAQLEGLESYAAYLLSRGESAKYSDDALEGELSLALGAYLARRRDASDALISGLSQRILLLRSKNSPLARTLEEILCDWPQPAVDKYLLDNVISDQADALLLQEAMNRASKLQALSREELAVKASGTGELAGICAAILDDAAVQSRILQTGDDQARNGLLALARLTRVNLPCGGLAPLLADPSTEEATRAYLLAVDSPESRQLLLGGGVTFGLSGGELQKITPRWEERFRAELRSSPELEEIYALLTTGYYESYGHFIVRCRAEGADLSWTGGGSSYRRRVLTSLEWKRFRDFLVEQKVDSWPKLNDVMGHNAEYQYLHLNRRNGYRVYAWNPQPEGKEKRYWQLTQLFKELLTGATELRYRVMDELPEARLLLDSCSRHVQAVQIFGDASGPAVKLAAPPELAPEMLRSEAFQRFALKPGGGAWYTLNLTRRSALHAGLLVDDSEDLSREAGFLNSPSWACQTPQGRVRVLEGNSSGLFLVQKNTRRRRLAEGIFAHPIVSGDGRWVLASKADENWAPPNSLVRMDLKSGKCWLVDVEPADNLDCLAFVPERGFLVRSAKDENASSTSRGPESPQYYLVDGESGRVQPVQGEFAPYTTMRSRPWQPTTRPGEYWAARTTDKGTEIGRYLARDFVFTPIRTYPQLFVDGSEIWVDEVGKRLYVCVDGNLLELPW